MSIGLLGTKIGMTQVFDHKGKATAVTIIQIGPCHITQLKNIHSDGYNAVQIGYKKERKHKLTRGELGHLNKAKVPLLKHLYEYKVESTDGLQIGQIVTMNQLKIGSLINVSSTSIGKGFCGCQKRHKFSRGPMSHGSKNHRQPGSIGAGTTPGRVFPGKKMAGRMGNKQNTIRNLKIIDIYNDDNIILVKGSVPGKKGNLVRINQK
uniref:Large ribosomal subunit protein uL3c n=1 Tax=Rhodymenia pseudopalmata TaxID=31502 RepID=A0A1C9C7X6_RHOPU|nr:ribosomal protein L3 [Rhodymenia pseudopalmata]AOM64479.1 ribosomal protein L3 [Rhodymenia pseudopalmata]